VGYAFALRSNPALPGSRLTRLHLALALLIVAVLALACSSATVPPPTQEPQPRVADSKPQPAKQTDEEAQEEKSVPSGKAQQRSLPTPAPRPIATGLRTELVADGLQLPANLTFAPDGRLFFTEVSIGRVRVFDRGVVQPQAFAEFDEAVRKEQGLLGLTLDPDFSRTQHVYLYYSQVRPGQAKPWRNRIVRLTDVDGKGADLRVVLDDLPIGDKDFNGGHNGGRLAFGPDRKLYVTLGDVGKPDSAQDRSKITGKLLRLNPDGSVPTDNPLQDSPVYASGFRNAWGLGFHPETGTAYVTENGGTRHDEVDRVVAGGNYGWPKVQGLKTRYNSAAIRDDPNLVDPFWDSYGERGGISGLAFYTGDLLPQYKNDLLFCTFGSSRLIRLRLVAPDYDRIEQEELLSNECSLDVVTGPDGAIYFSTINKIQRLVPAG
jgi:glucose/arabinose dehydrogenase